MADYDYDQGGLNGLGGVGGVGGTGLGMGSGSGMGIGVLNNAGNGGGGLLGSEASNLLYIKENPHNFSASFYMDEELRQQLTAMLQSAKVQTKSASDAKSATEEREFSSLRSADLMAASNADTSGNQSLDANQTATTLADNGQQKYIAAQAPSSPSAPSNHFLTNPACGNLVTSTTTESDIDSAHSSLPRTGNTSSSNRTTANSKLLQTLVQRTRD